MNDMFALEIRATIRRVDERGYPIGGYANEFQMTESATLPGSSFLEVMGTLGKFHELVEGVKAKNE